MSGKRTVFFAGGGTGGHIYPAIAVAERLEDEVADVCFFCSQRPIDKSILKNTPYRYICLPAKPLTASVSFAIGFILSFFRACKELIRAGDAVVVGVGGFVAAPVVVAARITGKPLAFINVDAVPGKANRRLARLSKEIYVQFADTADSFGKGKFKVVVSGCPLRKRFFSPDPEAVKRRLGLDRYKKTLLITGASSGAQSINMAVLLMLERLARYKDDWQVVHLTGVGKNNDIDKAYKLQGIKAVVLEYFEDMASLLAASDAAVGRCGAVSIAEFIAAKLPVVCVPYPYHQDQHQRLNALQIAKDGGAVVITDHKEDYKHTCSELIDALEPILQSEDLTGDMRLALSRLETKDASEAIAERLLKI